MANRSIEMYEYRQVVYRLRQGQSIRSINRDTAFGRNKLKEIKSLAEQYGWLSSTEMPGEVEIKAVIEALKSPPRAVSTLEPLKKIVEQWADADIAATVIHARLRENYNYLGSYNSVQRYIKNHKSKNPIKLTVPLDFGVGEAAQIDFGKGPELYDERHKRTVKTWYFVMTLCWSRHQYVELVTNQDVETWLQCHQNAFEWFGGVISKVIIDNPKCAITKACYHSPQVQRSYETLAEEYGFIISACPPRDPQKKGRVEAGVKYVKRNFEPLRNLRSLQEANRQLKSWVLGTAGNRIHGSTHKKPLSQFEEVEKAHLKPLPEGRVEISTWHKVNLYKDCHIRHSKCSYSVPHYLYGEELWIKVTPKIVTIYHESKEVAMHPRIFTPGDRQTKTEHLPDNAKEYFNRTPTWCLEQAKLIGPNCALAIENMLTDPVKDLLRQAQCLLRLQNRYGPKRLEHACTRASIFHSLDYQTIKNILKEGLDYEQLKENEAFDDLSQVYLGQGKYQRKQPIGH